MTATVAQEGDLLPGFDAFGDDPQAEVTRHVDHGR
jgi:hypothetical protein